jgi:hypothetical protein
MERQNHGPPPSWKLWRNQLNPWVSYSMWSHQTGRHFILGRLRQLVSVGTPWKS